MNFNDWIGSIGVGITLIAYFLNNFSLIERNGKLYFILNVVGATIACYASVLINYFPFIILEGTWAFLSLISLVKVIKKPQV